MTGGRVKVEMMPAERHYRRAVRVLAGAVARCCAGEAVADGPAPGEIRSGVDGMSPVVSYLYGCGKTEEDGIEATNWIGCDWEAVCHYGGLPLWAWPAVRALNDACWSEWECLPPLPEEPQPPTGGGRVDLFGEPVPLPPREQARYDRALGEWEQAREAWRDLVASLEDWWDDPLMRFARERLRAEMGMEPDPLPAALEGWRTALAKGFDA